MINKAHISEMAKKVFRHQRSLRDPQIMHPEREWLTGLGVMIVIFAIAASWSAHMYIQNQDVSVEDGAAGVPEVTVYRSAQVDDALRMIAERKNELQGILGIASSAPVSEAAQATSTATSTEVTTEEIIEVDVGTATSTAE